MSTRARTTPARAALDTAKVVGAGMARADSDGLASVTMRAVAADLGVTPMALYNHVASREQLIDAMVEHVVAGIPHVVSLTPWDTGLRERILAARSTINAHPWAWAAIETRTAAGPAVLAYMDSLMSILFAGGLSPDLIHDGMHLLSTRMWGFTRDVLPTPALPTDPAAQALALRAFSQDYPSIVRMVTTASVAGGECDTQAEFEFALDVIIEGLRRRA